MSDYPSILSRDCERPRSLAKVVMGRCQFDTAENAAKSLRNLEVLVRAERLTAEVSRVQGSLIIEIREAGQP